MPRRYLLTRKTFVCAGALALAGCSGTPEFLDSKNEGGWFSKPVNIFTKPDWAQSNRQNVNLGPSGPVGPEDLVAADGACPPAPAETAQASTPSQAPPPTEPVPDRLQTDGGGAAPVGATVMGGIALGMTECQAVRRAGQPSNVAISADEKGERKVVLTYLSGTWPGVYTFNSGRLKTIEVVPEQQKPKPAAKKKPAPKRARSAQ